MIILFGWFGDVFDYNKDWFFSYHGASQYLQITVFIAWQIQSIVTIAMARRMDKFTKVLNENVKSMTQQDSINAGLQYYITPILLQASFYN